MSKTSKQGTEQFVSLVRNTCFKQNDDPLEGFSLPWSIILWNKFQFMYNKRFCWWSELGENKIWEKQFSHCTLRWTHLVFSVYPHLFCFVWGSLQLPTCSSRDFFHSAVHATHKNNKKQTDNRFSKYMIFYIINSAQSVRQS